MRRRTQLFVIAAIVVASALVGYAIVNHRHHDDIKSLTLHCKINVRSELLSPDDKLKAIVFTRDCGGAGYPHTFVIVVPAAIRIPEYDPPEQKYAAAAWEGFCPINLLWRDTRTLLVETRGGCEGEEASSPGWARLRASVNADGTMASIVAMSLSDAWE
jgi:hypothetical protein